MEFIAEITNCLLDDDKVSIKDTLKGSYLYFVFLLEHVYML